MHVVLFEPQIPPNTGNVARTCAATGSVLHLVEPLGFDIDDRALKRAGLDYWPFVDVRVHSSLSEVIAEAKQAGSNSFFFTKFARAWYSNVSYRKGDYLFFGKETDGLPRWVHEEHADRLVRMPMGDAVRSLNLSNTVAIAVYEALRQQGFPNLS